MIGVTLVLGFVFMLCVEQCVNKQSAASYAPVSLEDGSSSSCASLASAPGSKRKSSRVTATIGLIVHSAGE